MRTDVQKARGAAWALSDTALDLYEKLNQYADANIRAEIVYLQQQADLLRTYLNNVDRHLATIKEMK